MAFNSLMLGQLLHAYLCRSRNRGLLGDATSERIRKLDLAIGGSICLQVVANFVPGL